MPRVALSILAGAATTMGLGLVVIVLDAVVSNPAGLLWVLAPVGVSLLCALFWYPFLEP